MGLPQSGHPCCTPNGDTPGMKIFIPLCETTLPLLGDADRLVPYQYGMMLFSQIEIIAPGEETPPVEITPAEAPAGHPVERPVPPPCPR